MASMTITRHGNNAHAELPACPFCKTWDWRTGSTDICGFTQVCYTCRTESCRGTSLVVYCGLGLAVIFERGVREFDSITTPPDCKSWLDAGIKMLRAAQINACIHGGKECPRSLVIDAATPAHALFGDSTWQTAEPASDLAPMFSARVAKIKALSNDDD